MGYYDDHYKSESRQNRSGGRRGWFLAGLIGAIVGVIAMVFFMPFLAEKGLMPSYFKNTSGGDQVESTGPTTTKNVDVNVTSGVTKAVEKVSPAVVGVINLKQANFFTEKYSESGIGSGIVYQKDDQYAYVVTNNHVIEGANKVEVRFDNNKKVKAKILGRDSLYDLAVLRIPSDSVKKVADFGNSDDLKRGEPVVAIGNPLGFSGSVTQGIVSSVGRTIPRNAQTGNQSQVTWTTEVIQTDAAINPGNSGGALVNLQGQVVGINSLKIAQEAVEGIGFAIPSEVVEPVIKELKNKGKIKRPHLGISIIELGQVPTSSAQELQVPDSVENGLIVKEVENGGPAAKAGIQPGDVVVSVDGHKISTYRDFTTYLFNKLEVGQTVNVKLYRMGEEKNIKVDLGGKVFS